MRTRRPLVYVAGPISKPDPPANVAAAMLAGARLLDSGLVAPYLPHLSYFWDADHPQDYETWMELDFDVLARCDALLRLPGESSGADREVALALALGILVFYDPATLLTWAKATQMGGRTT